MGVLVTGGTGHLGSWLVKALSEKGEEVTVLVRSPQNAGFLNFQGVQLAKGDITDLDSVKRAMKGADRVFHLAALSAAWAKNPHDFDRMNVEGTRNVLEAARESGVKRVLICSSAGNYGPSNRGIVNEETQREKPYFNDYERTKHLADELALSFHSAEMEVLIAFPTRVYGPLMHGKPAAVNMLIAEMVRTGFRFIPGNGKAIGNYVYIDDVTSGFLKIMENGRGGESYLLGGENLTYDEFYQMTGNAIGMARSFIDVPVSLLLVVIWLQKVASWFGRPPVLTPDWVNKLKFDYEVSSEKAVQMLNYEITPFRKGIELTIQYFRGRNQTFAAPPAAAKVPQEQ